MGTRLQFSKRKRVLWMDGVLAAQLCMCLIPRRCALNNGYDDKCYVTCIFYHSGKKQTCHFPPPPTQLNPLSGGPYLVDVTDKTGRDRGKHT